MNPRLRRRTSRTRATLAVLLYISAMTLMAIGYLYMTGSSSSGSSWIDEESSKELFYFMSGAQLLLIAIITPGLAVKVFGRRREEVILRLLQADQWRATFILTGELITSLKLMVLFIAASAPVYIIVHLLGGISTFQLITVFAFYLFVTAALGCFGVFFSAWLKGTRASIVFAYGVAMLMFWGTGLAAMAMDGAYLQGGGWGPGIAMGLNPMGTLLGILNDEFSRGAFGSVSSVELWHIFVPVYSAVCAGLLAQAGRLLKSS